VDTELWTEHGESAVVAWQCKSLQKKHLKAKCIDSPTAVKRKFRDITIAYSGWNGKKGKKGKQQKGREYVRIIGKSKYAFMIRAYGFQAGTAKVTYSWDEDKQKCLSFKKEKTSKSALKKQLENQKHLSNEKISQYLKSARSCKVATGVLKAQEKKVLVARKQYANISLELKKCRAKREKHGTKLKKIMHQKHKKPQKPKKPKTLCKPKVTAPDQVALDVTILIDGSWSIQHSGWAYSVKAAKRMAESFGAGTRVSAAVFSYESKWITKGPFTTPKKAVEAIGQASFPKGSTATAGALTSALLNIKRRGFKGAKQIVYVITDGVPNDVSKTAAAAARLRKVARLAFIPVGGGDLVSHMKSWASKPASRNIFHAKDFKALSHQLKKAVKSTCHHRL